MVAPPGNQAANGENKGQPVATRGLGLLDIIPIVPARQRSRSGEFPNSGFRHSELGSGRERSELSSFMID